MKWWLIVTSIVVVTVSAFASWHVIDAGRDSTAAPVAGRRSPGRRDMVGVGYVEPASEVRKLMFRTGGVIGSCSVQAGDVVRKGQLLLELDNSTQKVEVELAQKLLDQARADADHVNAGINPFRLKVLEQTIERLREKVRHLVTEVERYDQLVGQGGVSKQDHELTKSRLKQAELELSEQEAELQHLRHYVTPENRAALQAKVRHAQVNVRVAEERLQETRLLAPFDGTVLKLLKRDGEGISSLLPEPVLLFGDLSRLRVRAEIDERFVKELHVGQRAEVYGRNLLGKTYPGQVVEVERIMGDKTVFTRASTEKKDLNILQVVVEMESGFSAPVGLQVDVRIPRPAD